ncbi:DUF2752 domain-containing protein [Aureibaculum sp. A20]|uniref:DUF2752 domain-containing protein n=1 Tax=Aureibaculum flavum TaxID=2795986 RepID=A0ABS0WUT7_9FLAO|nr:DUF2752 domain-containing protein [Aureibaculum flavum]
MKYKKLITLIFILVVALFYFSSTSSQFNILLKCPLYNTTGIYCPGCGSQRAFHSLIHGDFLEALRNNIMLLLGIIALIYHYGIQLSNHFFKTSAKSIFNNKKIQFLVLGLFILFWILRNINVDPFSLLAPIN